MSEYPDSVEEFEDRERRIREAEDAVRLEREGSSSPLTPGAGDATQVAKDAQPGNAADSHPSLEVQSLRAELAEAKLRMHMILSTIYATHGYLNADGEIDTAAKFRAIERFARLDWDTQGMSRVV